MICPECKTGLRVLGTDTGRTIVAVSMMHNLAGLQHQLIHSDCFRRGFGNGSYCGYNIIPDFSRDMLAVAGLWLYASRLSIQMDRDRSGSGPGNGMVSPPLEITPFQGFGCRFLMRQSFSESMRFYHHL